MTPRQGKALALAIGVAMLLGAAFVLPVTEWLIAGVQFIGAHKAAAWPVYIAVYVAASVLLMPGSILTLAAGFVFGLPLGVVLVSIGSVLGASAAFLVGRYLARDWVRARTAAMPRFGALDQATANDGFVIVLLVRLSPLFPFNLVNYAFGLTSVVFRAYFLASWIGMLPATILYVYVGSLALDLTELAARGFADLPASRYLLVAGFVATVLLTALITRRATRALNRQLASSSAGPTRREPHDAHEAHEQ